MYIYIIIIAFIFLFINIIFNNKLYLDNYFFYILLYKLYYLNIIKIIINNLLYLYFFQIL
jgi:hypothetical protein